VLCTDRLVKHFMVTPDFAHIVIACIISDINKGALMEDQNQEQTTQVQSVGVPQQVVPAAEYPAQQENPGKTMGIISLVAAFFLPLVGLILGIIGLSQSKKSGMSNGMALAGIILSASFMVIGAILLFFLVIAGAGAVSKFVETCERLGPGEHYVDGVTYTCGESYQ